MPPAPDLVRSRTAGPSVPVGGLGSVADMPGGRPERTGTDTEELLDELAAIAARIETTTAHLDELKTRRAELVAEAARRHASLGVIARAARMSKQGIRRLLPSR